jgi:hypothetical protein
MNMTGDEFYDDDDRADLLRVAKERTRLLPLDAQAFREIDLALDQTTTEVLRDIVRNNATAKAAERWNNSRRVECSECDYKAVFENAALAKTAANMHQRIGYRHICIVVPRTPRIEFPNPQRRATPGRDEAPETPKQ